MSHFHDPAMVARYHEGPPRFVPGFADMQRMARVLLAERAPVDARVLVLGAGGGLELKAFADGQPGWTFDGVDPSAAMLELARQLVAAHGARRPGAPAWRCWRRRKTRRCCARPASTISTCSMSGACFAAGSAAPDAAQWLWSG